MKVKWNFSMDDLRVITDYFIKLNVNHGTPEERSVISILEIVGFRLHKKLIDRELNKTEDNASLSINLFYHEAFYVQAWFSNILNYEDNTYRNNILMINRNQLAKKVA